MRLTRVQTEAIRRIDLAERSGGTPESVTEAVVQALRAALGWDGYRVFSVDPSSLLLGRLLAASDGDAGQRERWLRHGYHRAESVPFGSFGIETRLRMGIRAITFSEWLDKSYGMPAAVRAGFDQAAYRTRHHSHVVEYHPNVSIDGNLLMNLADGGRWVATMQAYRVSGRAPFRASDIAFAHLLAPRMGRAIGAAMTREQQRRDVAPAVEAGVSGVVVLGADGAIAYRSDAGDRWLEALRVSEQDRETGLPSAILAAAAGIRGDVERAVSRVNLPGTVATIEATSGGSDGSVALVVSATRSARDLAAPAAWGLSVAEGRVTALVLQGRSNREVADELSISEHTVEWHLRRVFDRLGVRTRSQLVALSLSWAAPV